MNARGAKPSRGARILGVASLVGLLFVLPGCSGTTVFVVDPTGFPVVGAQVQCMTHSLATDRLIANSRGAAVIPWDTFVNWVDVTKPGYEPSRCDVNGARRARVTLRPLPPWTPDPSLWSWP